MASLKKSSYKAIMAATLLSAGIFCMLTSQVTYSWFGATLANKFTLKAGINSQYYESGDGTKESPYEIHSPRQFYHFAWLQDMGYYNKYENGQVNQTYFILSADLDMSEFVLPPAGTSVYPFVGSFDGQGHTISNLYVTNDKSEYTKDPTLNNTSLYKGGEEVAGVFGAIGSIDGDNANTIVPTGGTSKVTYDTTINEVKNLIIDNATIDSTRSTALIGIAAGYVNAPTSNIGVKNSTVKVKENTDPLVLGTRTMKNISDYSVAGYICEKFRGEENVVSEKEYEVEGGFSPEEVPEPGASNSWGSSIGINDLFTRLKEQKAAASSGGQYISHELLEYDDSGKLVNDVKTNSNVTGYTYKDSSSSLHFIDGQSDNDNMFLYLSGQNNSTHPKTIETVKASEKVSGLKIHIGSNYLSTTTSGTIATKNDSDSTDTIWVFSNQANNTGTLFAIVNKTNYYLSHNNSALSLTTNVSNAKTWVYEAKTNSVYNDTDGKRYYLIVENGTWKVKTTSYLYIRTSDGHFLKAAPSNWYSSGSYYRNSGLSVVTDQSQATKFVQTTSGSNTFLTMADQVDGRTVKFVYNKNITGEIGFYTSGVSSTSLYSFGEEGIQFNSNSKYLVLNASKNGWGFGEAYTQGALIGETATFKINIPDSTKYYLTNSFTITTSAGSGSVFRFEDVDGNLFSGIPSVGTQFRISNEDRSVYLEIKGKDSFGTVASTVAASGYFTLTNSSASGKYNLHFTTNSGTTYDMRRSYSTLKTTTSYGMCDITIDVTKQQEYEKVENDEFLARVMPEQFSPLSAIRAETYASSVATKEMGGYNTYFPISATKQGNNYVVDHENAGYYVGSGFIESGDNRGDIHLTKLAGNSVDGTVYTSGFSSDASNPVHAINAVDLARFKNYDRALEDFREKLTHATNSSPCGLYFNGSTLAMDKIVKCDGIQLDGVDTPYNNYEMPAGCVDVKFPVKGNITLFASPYKNNDGLFSLYEINRNSDKTIKEILYIDKIYGTQYLSDDYLYQYENSSVYISKRTGQIYTDLPDGYSVIYDQAWMNSPVGSNGMVYMELPVEPGEYALSSPRNGNNIGSNLLYLDIGQNGSSSIRDASSRATAVIDSTVNRPNGIAFLEADETLSDINSSNSAVFELRKGFHTGTAGTTFVKSESNFDAKATSGEDIGYSYITTTYCPEGYSSYPESAVGSGTINSEQRTTTLTLTDDVTSSGVTLVTDVVFTDTIKYENDTEVLLSRKIDLTVYVIPRGGTEADKEFVVSLQASATKAFGFNIYQTFYNDAYSLEIMSTIRLPVTVKEKNADMSIMVNDNTITTDSFVIEAATTSFESLIDMYSPIK